MRVLTFNLHTQYLYLLSHTGWDIENLIVTPEQGAALNAEWPWHTQPYGYPTHPGAVNAMPGLNYGAFFPEDINAPPPIAMAPAVDNIKNVLEATGDYDLVIFIETHLLKAYPRPHAGKRVLVNLSGFDHGRDEVDAVVSHVKAPWATYFPIGIPDDFPPRKDDFQAVLCNFGAAKLRSREGRVDIIEGVGRSLPFVLHDMLEEPWDYDQVRDSLSRFYVLLQIQNTPGGPPMSALEAMMAGLPVVAWDPHNHLAAAVHGKHLLKISNVQQAIVSCKRLLSNDEFRTNVGEAGSEFVKEHFSIEQFVDGWKEVAGD